MCITKEEFKRHWAVCMLILAEPSVIILIWQDYLLLNTKWIIISIVLVLIGLIAGVQECGRTFKRHRALIFSTLISVALLIVFLCIHCYLVLDTKWIIVSGVPILIGLIIGGYIKSFRGFGVELEMSLKEPISLDDVLESGIMEFPIVENNEDTASIQKASLSALEKLTKSQIKAKKRLRFINGKNGYYKHVDIQKYLEKLISLEYFEIVNEDGAFLYLMPRNAISCEVDKINKFIDAIEKGNIKDRFPKEVVEDFVLTTDSIVKAYRQIKRSTQSERLSPPKELLPVLNEKRELQGVIDIQSLEKIIAKEVVKNID
jgi:hypothetical protein